MQCPLTQPTCKRLSLLHVSSANSHFTSHFSNSDVENVSYIHSTSTSDLGSIDESVLGQHVLSHPYITSQKTRPYTAFSWLRFIVARDGDNQEAGVVIQGQT